MSRLGILIARMISRNAPVNRLSTEEWVGDASPPPLQSTRFHNYFVMLMSSDKNEKHILLTKNKVYANLLTYKPKHKNIT